jgi:alpha-galactosidase/6-phospho-beta-glucosidase family protein
VSTDVKATAAFLEIIKKKNFSHNAAAQMHKLFDRCNRIGRCSNDNQRQYQDLCNMLYSHAKQADKECKKVGAHAWSRMLAAAGRAVQYANEEFRRWKNHKFTEPGETNESAFTQAKQNRAGAYAQIHQIQVQSQELREVDLQLMAEEQAKEQNTSVANALKAILKQERDSGIFPLL